MSPWRIQGEVERADVAIGPVPRPGSWTPGEPEAAAGSVPESGKGRDAGWGVLAPWCTAALWMGRRPPNRRRLR